MTSPELTAKERRILVSLMVATGVTMVLAMVAMGVLMLKMLSMCFGAV